MHLLMLRVCANYCTILWINELMSSSCITLFVCIFLQCMCNMLRRVYYLYVDVCMFFLLLINKQSGTFCITLNMKGINLNKSLLHILLLTREKIRVFVRIFL